MPKRRGRAVVAHPPEPTLQQQGAITDFFVSSPQGIPAELNTREVSALRSETLLSPVGPVPPLRPGGGGMLQGELPSLQPLERPAEITLESIWIALDSLHKICLGILPFVQYQNVNMQKFEEDLKAQGEKVKSLEQSVQGVQSCNLLTQDKLVFLRKMETMENYTKQLNLRILNFPKALTMSPKDLFYKFLKEVFKYPEEGLPPLHKIYFIPVSVKKPSSSEVVQSNVDLNPINISRILETSEEEVVLQTTLLVTFVFLQDKEALLCLFFRLKEVSFMEGKISVFSDVSRTTQTRRKRFLELKENVKTLRAKFKLRFPCKYVFYLDQNTYVFYEPSQLQYFLEGKGVIMQNSN